MAHTLLASELRGMSAVVREALKRNVPVEQIIIEKNQKQTIYKEQIRKKFFHPDTKTLAKISSYKNGPRIAIIGGGLAGLTCAYHLKQAGYHAKVYEAAERAGGRCWTRRGHFEGDQLVERGGELIDSDHTAIRRLAVELGFTLDDLLMAEKDGTTPFFHFDGLSYSYTEAVSDLKKIWKKLYRDRKAADYPTLYNYFTKRGFELDHMSIVDWINETVPDGIHSKFGRLLDVALTSEFGAEASEQSALNLIYFLVHAFDLADQRYRIRGGNDQIVSRLEEILADQIEYGSKLVAIKENLNGSFTLTFQHNMSMRDIIADKVVVAIPFSCLRSYVDYSKANFRPLKETAIKELGMGTNTKLHIQCRDRHWEKLGCNGDTFSDTGYQHTYEVTRAQPGPYGILVTYSGGKASAGFDAGNHSEQVHRFVKEQLEPVLPGIASKWNGKATVDHWGDNSFIKGSNSYWKIGQYTRFAGIEGEREGNCHFAGEHTSIDYQGYMNGAVESGVRAANEILHSF